MEEKRMEEKRMEEKRMEEKRMEEKRMEEKRMEEKRMEEKRREWKRREWKRMEEKRREWKRREENGREENGREENGREENGREENGREEKRMEEKRMEEKRMEEKRREEKRREEKRREEKRREEKRRNNNNSVCGDSGTKIYAHQMVRTDSREQTLHAFVPPKNVLSACKDTGTISKPNTGSPVEQDIEMVDSKTDDGSTNTAKDGQDSSITPPENKKAKLDDKAKNKLTLKKASRDIQLISVQNLCKIIDKAEHQGLKDILEDHKFVGCVNHSLVLLQHTTKLYLANINTLSRELFYQIILFKFGDFGLLKLSEAAPIYELAMMALDSSESGWTEEDGSKDDLASYITDFLKKKSEMLLDYFSIEIDSDGNLCSLPLLIDNYVPNFFGLPMFILRLATEVEWDAEQECFNTLAKEVGLFYAFKPDSSTTKDPSSDKADDSDISWQWTAEHVVLPALRTGLVPPARFAEDGTLLQIANLPDLYKVFERC
ncbi:hypothetical protein QZH41_012541 [Actinostola sp. cb2023]|nr:hypothetical protein QZH41_012541 [Actinostola sp. cb2023]